MFNRRPHIYGTTDKSSLIQSLTPFRNTDFTARLGWWTVDVLSMVFFGPGYGE